MGTDTITEASATITVHTDDKISKKLPVFYNPDMKSNRDLTILFLNALQKKDLLMCDLMAGSGIRSIRFLKELDEGILKELIVNDANPTAVKMIEDNLKSNDVASDKITITNETADRLLAKKGVMNYIDIDPFGSPNPFLDLGCKKIMPKGILAVTATDTAPLCGTYPKACRRKYWATPLKSPTKHETATRILIRKCQLIAAQYEKALIPLCSFARQHYIRLFFDVQRGKSKVDKILEQHGEFEGAGPMWLGKLNDPGLIKKMIDPAPKELIRFLEILAEESKINTIGFHDTHKIASELKITLPKFERLMDKIRSEGFQASRTIFSEEGIRSDISKEEIKKIMKKFSQ